MSRIMQQKDARAIARFKRYRSPGVIIVTLRRSHWTTIPKPGAKRTSSLLRSPKPSVRSDPSLGGHACFCCTGFLSVQVGFSSGLFPVCFIRSLHTLRFSGDLPQTTNWTTQHVGKSLETYQEAEVCCPLILLYLSLSLSLSLGT